MWSHMNVIPYEWRNDTPNAIGCILKFVDGSFICVTWLIHMCDMTHSYVWHDSFICVTWLVHMCDMTHSYVWHASPLRVTWLAHFAWWDRDRRYVEVKSIVKSIVKSTGCTLKFLDCWFIGVTWLISTCDMAFIRVTWIMHTCDMTHSYVGHDSSLRVTWILIAGKLKNRGFC